MKMLFKVIFLLSFFLSIYANAEVIALHGTVVDANSNPLANRKVLVFNRWYGLDDVPTFPDNLGVTSQGHESEKLASFSQEISNRQGAFVVGSGVSGNADFTAAQNTTFTSANGEVWLEPQRMEGVDYGYNLPPLQEGKTYTLQIPYYYNSVENFIHKLWIVVLQGDVSDLPPPLKNYSEVYMDSFGRIVSQNKSTVLVGTNGEISARPTANSSGDIVDGLSLNTNPEIFTVSTKIFVANQCQGGTARQLVRESETFERRWRWQAGVGLQWLIFRIWGEYNYEEGQTITIDVEQEVTTQAGEHIEYTIIFEEVVDKGYADVRLRNQSPQRVPFEITTDGRYRIESRRLPCQ